MALPKGSVNTSQIFLYFGSLTLLVFLVAPENLLDIPTTYMLKNHLHATAPQVSMFRLLTGVPMSEEPLNTSNANPDDVILRQVRSPAYASPHSVLGHRYSSGSFSSSSLASLCTSVVLLND